MTTIGSFSYTVKWHRIHREYKINKISKEEHVNYVKGEIAEVVKLQEDLDVDVFVHGEPESNDVLEYFGDQLQGFASTVNGWV